MLTSSSFAQLGLAPIPTPQQVLPTYVIDIPAGAVSSNSSIHYVPPIASIPTDITIAWFNDDPGQVHTVTSGLPDSQDSGQLFNSGFLPYGAFYQVTFTTPGEYTYYCTLHPYMNGIVHVGEGSETGHHFTMKSGASLESVNDNSPAWTINKTQYDRTLFDFQPTDIAVDLTTPVVYNIEITDDLNNQTLFTDNFQVIGGTDLQVEFISNSNMNNTNVYGPDLSDPVTGAYHVEGNFEDGEYTMTAKLVSIGTDVIEDNIADEFKIRFIS
ncbi:MAG TPA: plastocyanin/azurin family copper-binding protein [Nitrososphaeraceae archaeon]